MEIRMVKCPRCETVYNAAMSAGCPNCNGQGVSNAGFSKTTMPGAGGVNGFNSTMAPGNNAFTSAAVDTFSKTAAPGENAQNVLSGTYFPPTKPPADNKFVHTKYVGENAVSKDQMRVTGWLVVTDGPNAGKDYRLHAGYNYIGKERGDVRIEGDDCISREKDSQVYCDMKKGKFYAGHVNGVNALEVNDEPVISGTTVLNAYDILTIGKTKLVFVPLCGEQFNWGVKE